MLCSRVHKYRHFSWSASTQKERSKSCNNKIISSSTLLSDKYSLQNTLHFHYIALDTKRLIHAHTHTTTLPIAMLTATYLMVNAWNVTVPHHTLFLLVDIISLTLAVITLSEISNEMTKPHCALSFFIINSPISIMLPQSAVHGLYVHNKWISSSECRPCHFTHQIFNILKPLHVQHA